MPTPNGSSDPATGPQRRSRMEDEVLEILARADRPASFTDHVRRRVARQRRDRLNRWLRPRRPHARMGSGTWLLLCGVLALLTLLIGPSSRLLANLLALGSVVCLLAPIINRFRRPRQVAKRWRGRDMDDYASPYVSRGAAQPRWFEELRTRFRKPPRRF